MQRRTNNLKPLRTIAELDKLSSSMPINTNKTVVTVDRYELSKTWYNLIIRLASRNPNMIEKAFIDMVYNKVVTIMKQKTDAELMADMQDILEAVDFARLSFLPQKKGYYQQ